MRRFRLINANGESFDLMDKSAFFHRPSGLGLTWEVESVRAGYDWVETSDELAQQSINGEMVFATYDRYSEFTAFCGVAPLTIEYAPLNKWYARQCRLLSIEKDEFGEDTGRLVCHVEFLCLSAWFENKLLEQPIPTPGEGKKYDYTYPYTYREQSVGSVEILNTGTMDAPCRIHVMGFAQNPSWALYVHGEVVSRGKINYAVPDGNKLVVDSSPRSMEISEYTHNNEFVRNLYGSSDFSTARFVYAPPGRSVLSFTQDGTGDIDAWVEVRLLAPTV